MSTHILPYRNPILPGFNPDPSAIRVKDDYFLVTSSFEFFPGVPIYHSKDLVHWKLIGHCLTRSSQLSLRNGKSSHGIYAATIREHNGRCYMTTVANGNAGEFGVSLAAVEENEAQHAHIRE
jgi:xylan 1,4-beta-xylosidase